MRISDWSSDVCSSDLDLAAVVGGGLVFDDALVITAATGHHEAGHHHQGEQVPAHHAPRFFGHPIGWGAGCVAGRGERRRHPPAAGGQMVPERLICSSETWFPGARWPPSGYPFTPAGTTTTMGDPKHTRAPKSSPQTTTVAP